MSLRLLIEVLLVAVVLWAILLIVLMGTVSLGAMMQTWAVGIACALSYGAIRVGMVLFMGRSD